MSNSRHTFAGTTLKGRLITLCAALVASGSVLGTVLVLFDSAGDAAKMAQAAAAPTKVAVAAVSARGSSRR